MRLDVYPTDAEAFEAAAALVAGTLRAAAGAGDLALALAGGRSGRGVMLALAARGELPWERVVWYLGDERCVTSEDALSNAGLARESLFIPRGIAPARIVAPAMVADDPAGAAAAYGESVVARLGTPPAFDVLVLGIGLHGEVASLAPGARALGASTPYAAVAADEVVSAPRVGRISVSPATIASARRVVVVVTGDAKAAVVARVLRDPVDPVRLPAQLVLPSERVQWVIDRAAAAELLRGARQVPDAPA